MSQESKHKRRSFSDEFKRGAVNLIVKQGYSFRAAADTVGVGEGSLRLWHRQLAAKPDPVGDDASLAELKAENQRLRYHLPANCDGLGLPRRRSRPVQPQSRWLGDLQEPGDSGGQQRFAAGGRIPKSDAGRVVAP